MGRFSGASPALKRNRALTKIYWITAVLFYLY
jgi:hypothetical protein